MDLRMILMQLDDLFKTRQIDEIEGFLIENINQADEQGEKGIQITLLNELIGYYRDLGEFEKSLQVGEKILVTLESANLNGTMPYATSKLNIANAMRAAGEFESSKKYYEEVIELYKGLIDESDFGFASLYNNFSLLYQEMGEYDNACKCLDSALEIVKLYPEARIEEATTHTNLALSLIKQDKLNEAISHLEKAFFIFEQGEESDYHYSAALGVMAEVKLNLGELEEAVKYYQASMDEINKHMGKTVNYEIMEANLLMVKKMILKNKTLNGMELCKLFYEEVGSKMIREKFAKYESEIAVGLVGEGSECFGFDDEYSMDHDFGPGFCMWITDELYEKIGNDLQTEYDMLPKSYMGITRVDMPQAGKRLGVFRIGDFYDKYIGVSNIPQNDYEWIAPDENQFATVTNGQVFRDDLGEFTKIRKALLKYYPQSIYVKKVANTAILMAQTGQYNYSRMLKREDNITARITLSMFYKNTMDMAYLLNRKYAPYYKWAYKGMDDLDYLKEIKGLINDIEALEVGDEKIIVIIEEIASRVICKMKELGLTRLDDNFLEHHREEILNSMENNLKYTKEELVNEIIELEWEAFDKVQNIEGCRAECQNNFPTFNIMRRSQFNSWNEELIMSYIEDFKAANDNGRNLVTEKYARMMVSTDPEEYLKIKDCLPEINKQKEIIIEEIVKIQIAWMEEFATRYPKAAGNARVIHTLQDSDSSTSYETYLRGELLTYGDATLEMYGRMIVELIQKGENLAEKIIEQTIFMYGYKDIDDYEAES